MATTMADIQAGAQVAEGIAGMAESFMGDDPSQPLRLPPEAELQFISDYQAMRERINQDQVRITQLSQAFDQRIEVLQGVLDATIPEEEAIKRLTATSQQIAQAFGGDVKQAIESGFLTDLDQETLDMQREEIENLQALESEEFKDPQLERQLLDERESLEQELRRQGVGPQGRLNALREFEQAAKEMRFNRAEQLRTGRTERGLRRLDAIGARGTFGLNARQQGFNQAVQGFDAVRAQLGDIRSTAQTSAQVAQAGVQGVGTLASAQVALDQSLGSRYQLVGQTGLSKGTRRLMEGGFTDTPSVFDQTGVSRDMSDRVVREIALERNQQTADNFGLNRSRLRPINTGRRR